MDLKLKMQYMTKAKKCTGLKAFPPRTVFQADNVINVTLDDVDDLIDCTHTMPVKIRRDYFYANGVDYDKVVKYYNTVKQLNAILNPPVPVQVKIVDAIKENFRLYVICFTIMCHILFANNSK